MSTKAESPAAHRFDPLLWVVVLAIVAGGIYANMVYGSVTLLYRALAGVAVAAVVVAIGLQTQHGQAVWNLAKEARVEVRKVVWPTRQETIQTTLLVVGVVILVGLMLWGIDSLLSFSVQGVIG